MCYKILIYGLGERYNQNFNVIKYYEVTQQFSVIGVTAKRTPDICCLDGYDVIEYQEIGRTEFDYLIVMSEIYFNEIVNDLLKCGIKREKIISYRVLQIPGLDFERYITFKNRNISIISNNCWGGVICRTLGIECRSPFKNLSLEDEDYLKLLKNFSYYIGCELTFLEYAFNKNSKKNYPVMLLDNVKVHCNHDTDPDEAAAKWNRRRVKINYDNLFVEMYTESRETMEAFLEIEGYKQKLCFVPFETDAENVKQLKLYHGQKHFWEAVNSNAGNGANSIVYNSLNLLEQTNADRQRKRAYKLSICIPNYNRLDCLERLIGIAAEQICRCGYQAEVEICISDDCSSINPEGVIEKLRKIYSGVAIYYKRNERNMGMDYNFLNSVRMAHGEYAWIIGNDDLPTEQSLKILMKAFNMNEKNGLDFIITPFDCFDYDGHLQEQNKPFGSHITGRYTFDTSDRKQLHQLIMSVDRNGVLFDFLSNIVFKRERWIEHGDMFEDKMNSIFIQIYMNMQTLTEGAKVLYLPEKIIKNFLDYKTNETIDRQYKVFVGLYDVYQYFLQGEELEAIKRQVVDRFLQSELFELDETEEHGRRLRKCQTEKIEILKKYYRPKNMRNIYFMEKSVIIYGAGELGKRAANELKSYGTYIVGFCDRDKEKEGTTVCGVPVFNVEELLEYTRDDNEIEVVVANFYSLVSIVKMLEQKGIWKISIIT